MISIRKSIVAAGFATALTVPPGAQAQQSQWIVLGDDAARSFASSLAENTTLGPEEAAGFAVSSTSNGRTVAELTVSLETMLQAVVHEDFHRCGGYTVHPSAEAALAEANNPYYAPAFLDRRGLFTEGIDQQAHVGPALGLVDPTRIVDTIQWMQGNGTRYYQSAAGQTAAQTLKAQWEAYAPKRDDVSVALYDHSWTQDSVVATIAGAELPDEIVVIGAHLDSINSADVSNAPGADDDASGVAVVSEVLRVILDSGFKPRRTLQFMAYAAEEVGLRGSRAIAADYDADDTKSVVAALQMDMTGFAGSPNDVYFITDYVSTDLTDHLKDLIVAYNGAGPHRITFGETACGYACSDHAAWTGVGVPAAFPFEALFADYNTAIHSPADLLPVIDTSGAKQAKFAKLGVEFMMEVAKSAGDSQEPVRAPLGFAWGNDPASANYTPAPAYAYNSANGPITASRTGTGSYTVTFKELGGHGTAGGNVQVTGYGTAASQCKVQSWGSDGADFLVHVRCYRANGTPVDDRYNVLVTWP